MFKYVSFKYLFDFSFSFVILILILPFILLVLIILRVDLNESPFFIQKRPGFKGKVFSLYKFKTMRTMFDDKGNLLSDKDRLTLVGRIIRTLSIDELPQLLNILKGEMSFIGPRPLLLDYLSLYSFEQMKRHNVIPGISGYAQVNGRNLISWKEKFKLDLYYVENQSFFLDLKILFLTFKNVFTASGVNSDINITMEKFNGKN
tara:strand:+ start:156 stop:764 length:609 start_codon:yes stop_codon:yes gene_type:complete